MEVVSHVCSQAVSEKCVYMVRESPTIVCFLQGLYESLNSLAAFLEVHFQDIGGLLSCCSPIAVLHCDRGSNDGHLPLQAGIDIT